MTRKFISIICCSTDDGEVDVDDDESGDSGHDNDDSKE